MVFAQIQGNAILKIKIRFQGNKEKVPAAAGTFLFYLLSEFKSFQEFCVEVSASETFILH
jgi:hypothetical protein